MGDDYTEPVLDADENVTEQGILNISLEPLIEWLGELAIRFSLERVNKQPEVRRIPVLAVLKKSIRFLDKKYFEVIYFLYLVKLLLCLKRFMVFITFIMKGGFSMHCYQ